jgi:hypothetical protein
VLIHVVLFAVVWWLMRRSFDRAIHGGEPLKTQRAFWPLLILFMILGGLLLVRVLFWTWTHGYLLLTGGIVGLVVFAFVRLRRDIRDVTGRVSPDRG